MSNGLGQRIIALTEANGMTRRDLATKLGISEVSMSRYVNGDRIPRTSILYDMATILHTTVADLLGKEEESADFESDYLKIHRLIARNAPMMSAKQKKEIVNALFESDDQEG